MSKVNAKKEEDTSILPGFDEEDEEDDDDEDYDDDEYEEEYDNHDDEDDYEDYSQRIDDRFSHPVQKSAKGNIYTSSSNQDMKKYDNVFEDGELTNSLNTEFENELIPVVYEVADSTLKSLFVVLICLYIVVFLLYIFSGTSTVKSHEPCMVISSSPSKVSSLFEILIFVKLKFNFLLFGKASPSVYIL